MKTYTKEQKKEYFSKLREQWNTVKNSLDEKKISTYEAIIKLHGLNVSMFSFAFTYSCMESLGLSGIPYIDCKTFHGWKESGFKVRKGETSKIKGVTWIKAESKDESNEKEFMFPKTYNLFHKTQVEAI